MSGRDTERDATGLVLMLALAACVPGQTLSLASFEFLCASDDDCASTSFCDATQVCREGDRLSRGPPLATAAPLRGPIGTVLTFTGASLDHVTSVRIGDTSALLLHRSQTELRALVMPGTTTGRIELQAEGQATPLERFVVQAPATASRQAGPKLVPTDLAGQAEFGAPAVSADGRTVIIGAARDAARQGAAWIFEATDAGTWAQARPKLVGNDVVGSPEQGRSVAVSADGRTALVGGRADGTTGAAWVYSRDEAGAWAQQGPKLAGSDATSSAEYGWSVALSADGRTAVIGGPNDTGGRGASWVFIRDDSGTWRQQGSKLFDPNDTGGHQGTSVAVSADGTAFIAGAPRDGDHGTAHVYVRDAAGWVQRGARLTPNDASGRADFGSAVGISSDGSTVVVGGPADRNNVGAVWVFTWSPSGAWVQHGPKLAVSNVSCRFGVSVALSLDGARLLAGGDFADVFLGGAWRFSREGDAWRAVEPMLRGSGAAGPARQGLVALSPDEHTVVLGGTFDDGNRGAGWVFTP
ncbi:MAG: IPT/TIG domain-containing protein [Archangium sp.]|nr:IPT/TIG domain-containing protein [Archangium sp.]